MADDELKRLLDGLFSDIPTEAILETPPRSPAGPSEAQELEGLAARFQAAARLSRAASSILDQNELLPTVAELIREEFGYYYVGIFLVDREGQWAVLQAGTGSAGQQMLAQGHRLKIGGGSMVGWCVANQQARIALDVGDDAVRFDNPVLPKTRSEMALPLRSRGRMIGAVTIQSEQPAAFSEQDITILQTMSDQLANAIENARLFEERDRRIVELAIVNEIGQALSTAQELEELLKAVHQQVSRLFDTTNFYIATYREGSDHWTSAFHIEGGERLPSAHYSINAGLTGYIIRSRQPLLFRSLDESIAFNEAQGAEAIGEMARSWLGVPLIAADKLVGVMGIQDYRRENLYDEQDLALYATIAGQVATALDNLQLLEDVRRRAQQLEAVNEVGRAVTSVLDLDAVLRQIVDISKARFGHYCVSILLVDGDRLVFRAGSTVGDSGIRAEAEKMSIDLMQGPSLNAEAARTGQPVLVNEVLTDPRFLPMAELPDTRAELDVPIEFRGQVIGVLGVQSAQPFAYDETDVALLQLLASQAGVAIENARLFEELQQRLEEMTMLTTVSQTLASAPLEVEEIGTIIARQFVEVMGVPEASLSVLDPEEGMMRVFADFYGDPEEGRSRREEAQKFYRLEDYPATARVVETLEPLVVQASDPGADPAELAYMEEYGVTTLVVIPLAVKGQAIGVVELEAWEKEHRYTADQISLATTLANQAAVALENVRLLEQAQRYAQEQTILRQITETISGSLEMQELLDTTLGQILEALDFDAGLMSLRGEDAGPLFLAAEQGLPGPMVRRLEREGLPGTLCDFVYQSGETVCISDIRQGAPVDVSGPIQHGLLTYLGIPLSYRGESEGTICLFSRTLRELTSQEVALLEAIGRQIVIGLENARLFRETQAALAEVEATHRSYLRRGWQEHLRLREMRDRSGFVCDRVGGGRAEDVRAAADLWRPEMERALMEGGAATAREDEADGGGRHGLAVPISLRGETLGVLGVESSTHARTWSESDIALLQAVSEQLAQTLEMARLFADTQRRAEREQLIAEITTRIRASTGVEDILKTTAEELGRALGTSRTRVRLGVESPSSPPGGVDLEPSEEAQPREYEGE